MKSQNPYTHLRTLLDDESKHEELCARLWCLFERPGHFYGGVLQDASATHYPGGKIRYEHYTYTKRDDGTHENKKGPEVGWVRNYTTNLDALLPLWPEGWRFILDSGIYTNVCRALIYGGQELGSTTQTTPALAMLDCLLQVLEYEWEGKR
jgi:hypothetical protein